MFCVRTEEHINLAFSIYIQISLEWEGGGRSPYIAARHNPLHSFPSPWTTLLSSHNAQYLNQGTWNRPLREKINAPRWNTKFYVTVFGTFNAYQLLTSKGPHVWKVWNDDDDDDALKALYRASSMCTYFHSKPMHSWPGLCVAQCAWTLRYVHDALFLLSTVRPLQAPV